MTPRHWPGSSPWPYTQLPFALCGANSHSDAALFCVLGKLCVDTNVYQPAVYLGLRRIGGINVSSMDCLNPLLNALQRQCREQYPGPGPQRETAGARRWRTAQSEAGPSVVGQPAMSVRVLCSSLRAGPRGDSHGRGRGTHGGVTSRGQSA